MKKIFTIAMLFLFAAAAHAEQVSNQSVLKVLKAKGLITDDDVKAALQDKKNDLEFFGQFQIEYKNESSDPAYAAALPGRSDILMRRARLGWKVWVADNAFINVLADFGGSPARNVKVEDAYFDFVNSPECDLLIGQSYVPFSRDTITGTGKMTFIDQGGTSTFAIHRQLGVAMKHTFMDKLIETQIGLYDGFAVTAGYSAGASGIKMPSKIYDNTDQTKNDNGTFLYAARVEIHPMGYMAKGYENFDGETKYTIGASWYTSADRNVTLITPAAATATASSNGMWGKGSNAFELDMQTRVGGLDFLVEYISRTFEYRYATTATAAATASAGSAADFSAGQNALTAQASYLVMDNVSVALRYDKLNYGYDNGAATPVMGGLGQKDDAWMTLGVNCYFAKHNLKLQANYVMKDETMVSATAEKPKNDQILVQMNYLF